MKKLLILGVSILAFVMMLCIGASAKEYSVSTYQELSDAFSEINSKFGEDSTIVFKNDITGSYGFGLTYPFKVTVDLNTFKYEVTSNRNGMEGSGFYVNNNDAVIAVKNGSMKINDVGFWPAKGRIVAENVTAYTEREEVVWWNEGDAGDLTLIGCTLGAASNDIIKAKGKCGSSNGRIIQIIDCTISESGKVDIPCPAPGSIIKNTVFHTSLLIDAWHKDHLAEVQLINVTAPSLTTGSGGTYARAIDCTIGSYAANSDSSGKSKITVIKSPSCSETGLETVYNVGSTSEPTVLDIVPHSALSTDCTTDIYCSMCESVLVSAKKNDAHNKYFTPITYPNGYNKSGEKTEKCTDCDYCEVITVSAIFDAMGYTSKDTTGFGTGISLNIEALEAFEASTGKTLSYGIVAFNPKFLNVSEDEKVVDTFFVDGMINASKGALQVEANDTYRTFSLLITGFTPEMDSLELVFAGYVYESDDKSTVQLFQKNYGARDETPMKTQVVRETVLHTITISSVCTPVQTGGKIFLDKFTTEEKQ